VALTIRRAPTRWRGLFAGLAIAGLTASALYVGTSTAAAAPDLLSQGATASASSSENGGTLAPAAVDGNAGTRWSSTAADGQWLRVDLGSTSTISQVTLNWENAYASSYRIQTSANGADGWTTIKTVTGATGGVQTLAVSGSGRYVRVEGITRATQWGISLWEFQVFGTRSGAPPTTTPPSGPIVRVAEFLASCPFSHRLPDDPIVAPRLPGGSHMHAFFGNTSTNAFSDVNSLLAANSNCSPALDLSSYWIPDFYNNNQVVTPDPPTFYYLGEGVRDDVIARIQPLPLGLRIVAGNAKATQPDDSTNSRWSCLHAGHVNPSKNFVECPAGTQLESYLDFPQCWNGRDLDSADHKSHMAYPVNGDCPATHPVPVPKLRQVVRYPISGNPANFRLSSGAGFTMHGDFFNAWPEAEMLRRVRDCINPIIKCGVDGRP
jgi:hypothetical protein